MDRIEAIAEAFITARERGVALAEFPVGQPETLDEAYRIQDLEVDRMGDRLTGWKIAAVRPELRAALGAERVAGPITRLIDVRSAAAETIDIPVVEGGFAAVEAEFACLIGRDLPIRGEPYSEAELRDAVGSLHIAIEVAGSPLETLNALGPTAVVSDHGNNAAIVVGAALPDWRDRPLESLTSRVSIDGTLAGEGHAARVAGGPIASLAFLVDNLAKRGRALKAGDWVSTGATTGVHRSYPGNTAVVDFGPDGRFDIRLVPQTA